MVEDNHKAPTELDTFLPQDGTSVKVVVKEGSLTAKGDFDPFTERKVANPTTDCDTLTHLLKAALGTGILAMPVAFQSAGLIVGVFATMLVAFICTHCAYILVRCAHVLYYKARKTHMSFADTVECAFLYGPKWSQRLAGPSRYFIQSCLFITYFGTCSVYSVIVAANFKKVLVYHMTTPEAPFEISDRIMIAALLVPLIFLTWVPDLKYLAPVSMIANVFMGTALGITFYYLVKNIENFDNVLYIGPIKDFPNFLSISIFAMEAIGVVMPLENAMKTPQHFVGICGVLNRGMSGVTLIYITLGFLGYAAFPGKTEDSITLNLPTAEIPAQIVLICTGLAVFCTFALQFFVILDIVINQDFKDRFKKNPVIANYALRTVLVIGCVLLAIVVPTIGPFIGLIGAFCFSILGLFVPAFIEIITYWDIGFGRYNWIVIKNVIIFVIAAMALGFGSNHACNEILHVYKGKNETVTGN